MFVRREYLVADRHGHLPRARPSIVPGNRPICAGPASRQPEIPGRLADNREGDLVRCVCRRQARDLARAVAAPSKGPGGPDSLTTVEQRPIDSQPGDAGQGGAARPDLDIRRRGEQARARSRAIRQQIEQGRPQWERMRDSAFARLRARLDTMPVIEQAKGVLMAQHRCGPDEALTRRAARRNAPTSR